MDTAFKKSLIYILITAFCSGTMETVLKIGGSSFTALQLTFLRFLIGGLVLLPLGISDLKKKNYRLSCSDWLYLLLLGSLGICFSMTLFQLGLMDSNANTASVIISANPVFTMVFAYFIIGEPFTKRKLVVLLLSITGLFFVANPFNAAEENTVKGILYVTLASVSFGLYSAIGKKRAEKIGANAQNSISFLLGSAVEFAILMFRGEPVLEGITPETLPVLLYAGFVVTGLGYYCYLRAIILSGPSNASIAFFIKPVIAVISAFIVLSEPITLNVVIGVILILAGSVINMRKAK